MYRISVEELRTEPQKYIAMAQSEDILVMDNGREIGCLTAEHAERMAIALSLIGILPGGDDMDEDWRAERYDC